MSPLRPQSQRRRGETRGGRVPQKIEIWGDVFYGWSLRENISVSGPNKEPKWPKCYVTTLWTDGRTYGQRDLSVEILF